MIDSIKEHDFGENYKTFKELQPGNLIYVINLRTLEIKEAKIKEITVKDNSDCFSKNHFIVTYKLENYDREFSCYDGNSYAHDISFYEETINCSDKRITEIIQKAMQIRNKIQWSTLTSIFGNPMDGYAKESIIIG